MALLDRIRTQDAVYWPPALPDEQGNEGYGDPIAVKVRWTDRQELDINASGEEWASSAVLIVGPEPQLNGVMWKGRLADVPYPTEPKKNPNASVIQRIDEIPANIKATKFLRKAFL